MQSEIHGLPINQIDKIINCVLKRLNLAAHCQDDDNEYRQFAWEAVIKLSDRYVEGKASFNSYLFRYLGRRLIDILRKYNTTAIYDKKRELKCTFTPVKDKIIENALPQCEDGRGEAAEAFIKDYLEIVLPLNERAQTIIRKRIAGYSTKQLSEEYGFTVSNVSLICKPFITYLKKRGVRIHRNNLIIIDNILFKEGL